jgi:hypothetical protein
VGGAAHGPEEHGVVPPRDVDEVGLVRRAELADGGLADRALRVLEARMDGVEHGARRGGHLGADAITRQQQNAAHQAVPGAAIRRSNISILGYYHAIRGAATTRPGGMDEITPGVAPWFLRTIRGRG